MKNLIKLLNEFLAERKESEGGFAPVSLDDMKMLQNLIWEIIITKWGADPDGDYPISYQLVNRNERRMVWFNSMPYPHKDLDGAFEVAISNLETAVAEASQVMSLIQLEKRQREERKDLVKLAGEIYGFLHEDIDDTRHRQQQEREIFYWLSDGRPPAPGTSAELLAKEYGYIKECEEL